MEPDATQLSAIVIITVAIGNGLIKLVELAVNKLSKAENGKPNGNGEQVKIDVAVMKQRLDTIENNHLHHLKEEIDKQTKWMEKHDEEHRLEREVLWQIAYSMGIRKLPDKPQ